MQSIKCLILLAIVSLVGALDPHGEAVEFKRSTPPQSAENSPRTGGGLFLNQKTSKFAVKGNDLPEVDFNIGETYAGSLPIGPPTVANANSLWFWFFPSTNPAAKKEIVIWLSGGPGCSSLSGVFQESGKSSYSWNKLTNVIYIDQPVGTGFSKGNITVSDETDVANYFMGFWKNFVDTFSIQGYKIYLTGESCKLVDAGQYVPWIASAMLDTGNKTYFNVSGVYISDPVINYGETLREGTYNNIMGLDANTMAYFKATADACGYTSYHAQHTSAFPPTGPIPAPQKLPDCDLYGKAVVAAYYANPCFNVYHLTDYCPYLWSELGYPSLGGGPNNYFDRSDVQRAIHAPRSNFWVCELEPNIFEGRVDGDISLPSGLGPLPSVIDRTQNVIIAHGLLDFVLFADGSLITIQNMTWGGLQGFRTPPSPTSNFYVPTNANINTILGLVINPIPYPPPQHNTAGQGYQGVTHSERGLTFVTVNLAGHFVAQYTPGAAYRQLEFLLGRISSLEEVGPYTTG
ncbi:alpha/beta-hydrolase [Cadophora sp. DSE1049]|nr:alpha/beta-hydrolase [Cadophora sp. DSE1049]